MRKSNFENDDASAIQILDILQSAFVLFILNPYPYLPLNVNTSTTHISHHVKLAFAMWAMQLLVAKA